MIKISSPIFVTSCLLWLALGSVALATDIGLTSTPVPEERQLEELAPAGLDETTLELFVSAVADLHKTATNLSKRLHKLDAQIAKLRTRNKKLEKENSRLRKALRLQVKVPKKDWHTYPLDKEVKDANVMLDKLVSKLTGLAPR